MPFSFDIRAFLSTLPPISLGYYSAPKDMLSKLQNADLRVNKSKKQTNENLRIIFKEFKNVLQIAFVSSCSATCANAVRVLDLSLSIS